MPKKRRSSSKNASVTLFALVILLILGAYYALTGNNPGGVFDAGTPTVAVPTATRTPVVVVPSAVNASGAWWEVYFTDPLNVNDPEDWQGSIEGRLIEKINAAQTSIHIASFEFDLTPVAEALIVAQERGVDVRWVTDDEFGIESDEEPGHGQFALMEDAGIEIRSDTRSALMHNKFWIFDSELVWTGSTNITENGIFKQDNNTIVIQSAELAAIYEREFQEMWNGEFGPTSTSQLAQQTTNVDGSVIKVIFTSEDPALEDAIIPIVNSATRTIRFLAFSYTDYPLANAMIQRSQNGVNVAGVFDKTQSGGQGAEIGTLLCAQVPVRQDGNPQFMHNKIIVVDERYVITGSLNYSTSAETSNDENVIIIDNPDIAKLYMQDFERVWTLATEPEAGRFPCQ
ncbi:MAG TPA: phospholipase D-like domain-containing protein [Anaerolineales bacterium]|nr:phospholipase D-like domain-containing protein [Anaerolineales bacterium]